VGCIGSVTGDGVGLGGACVLVLEGLGGGGSAGECPVEGDGGVRGVLTSEEIVGGCFGHPFVLNLSHATWCYDTGGVHRTWEDFVL
jgi:hypothetical protein